jgi:hypothetical protein
VSSLEKRFKIICESPSTMSLENPILLEMIRPCMSTQSSIALLVLWPRLPAEIRRMFPWSFLKTNPQSLSGLGFPLEAPSKFSLMKLVMGFLQEEGLERLGGCEGG